MLILYLPIDIKFQMLSKYLCTEFATFAALSILVVFIVQVSFNLITLQFELSHPLNLLLIMKKNNYLITKTLILHLPISDVFCHSYSLTVLSVPKHICS